jgi:tetratricopeptide (TPR) repeat protein
VTRRTLSLAVLAAVCGACGGAPSWVEAARTANGLADAALLRGDAGAALTALDAFADAPVPKTVARSDRRRVLQDVLYRLSELETLLDARRAVAYADRGLALGEHEDVFTANLWVAKGDALEQLGDDSGAARAFARALRINEGLLDAAGVLP